MKYIIYCLLYYTKNNTFTLKFLITPQNPEMPFKKSTNTTSFQELATIARAKSGTNDNHTNDNHTNDNFTSFFPNSNVSIKFFDKKSHKVNSTNSTITVENSLTQTISNVDMTVEAKPVNKEVVHDKPQQGKSDQGKPPQMKPVQEKPPQEKPPQDKPPQDKPVQGKPQQVKTVQDKPVQEKPPQVKHEQKKSHKDNSHKEKPQLDNPKQISTSVPPNVEKPTPLGMSQKSEISILTDGSQLNLMQEITQNPAQNISAAVDDSIIDNSIIDEALSDEFINALPIKNKYKVQIIKALEVSRSIETPPPTSGFISCITSNDNNIKPNGVFTPSFTNSNLGKTISSPIIEDVIVYNQPPVNSKLKTKMCSFYLKGQCTKGDNCTFIHNDQVAKSTQIVKNAFQDIGPVMPPLCRYGQNCTHLAKGECSFGHNKSLVMHFNLARKQNNLPPVKVGAIYQDTHQKDSKKPSNNNKSRVIAVK